MSGKTQFKNENIDPLHRSKSYDAKLNYDIATPIYSDNDVNSFHNLNNLSTTNSSSSNNGNGNGQAQIIVTSFAPDAKLKTHQQQQQLSPPSSQMRPASHQVSQDGLSYAQDSSVSNEKTIDNNSKL